jgi:hypothetical protein
VIRQKGDVSMAEMIKAYRIFVEELERSPKYKQEYNIKMDVTKIRV